LSLSTHTALVIHEELPPFATISRFLLLPVDQPTFAVLKTTPLPVKGILSNQGRGGFDITPDGKSFVVMLPQAADPGKAPAAQINITLNWFDELKQRVPVQWVLR